MKFTDINENLTEGPFSGPAGFGKRAKAKLQKNMPFAKGQQRRGKKKDEMFAKAKEIKDELMDWKAEAFASGNGEKEPLSMQQFLDWAKSHNPKLGQAIEAVARSDKDYADFFAQAVDKKGEQSSTASDEKVKPRAEPEKYSDEEKAAIKQKYADDAEAEAKELGSEDDDANESVEEDSDDAEPKVDMSASIYESRLRAFLNEDEDVGVNKAKTLADNQIDTLIVKGLEKQKQHSPSKASNDKDPDEYVASSPNADTRKISDEEADRVSEYIENFMRTRVIELIDDANIDKSEKQKMASELDDIIAEITSQIRIK